MKAPFDLQKALEGHKLVTRDGREVRHFYKSQYIKNLYPYGAEVMGKGSWIELTFTKDGRFNSNASDDPRDLFLEVNQIVPKDALKPIPKELPNIPDGYVYMGFSREFEYNKELTRYGYYCGSGRNWDFNEIHEVTNSYGVCGCEKSDGYYIFPEDSQTVKINLELKAARELIGKTITRGDSTYLKLKEEHIKIFYEQNAYTSLIVDMEIDENGYCIAVCIDERTSPIKQWKVVDQTGDGTIKYNKEEEVLEIKTDQNIKVTTSMQKTNKTFEEKLAEAQKLIGKTVKWLKTNYRVDSIFVAVKGENQSSFAVRAWADKHGYCIALKQEGGSSHAIPFDECEEVEEEIKINGYVADFSKVKSEDVVVFGCAKIRTFFFRDLFEMMKKTTDSSYKQIKGPFQIGAGTFTEEDVKKIYNKILDYERQ